MPIGKINPNRPISAPKKKFTLAKKKSAYLKSANTPKSMLMDSNIIYFDRGFPRYLSINNANETAGSIWRPETLPIKYAIATMERPKKRQPPGGLPVWRISKNSATAAHENQNRRADKLGNVHFYMKY